LGTPGDLNTDKIRVLREEYIMTRPESSSDNSTPVIFVSHGVKIKGWFFSAMGPGRFPVVILLQGFPGSKGDLFGLGQKLSETSINAFAFNYSGTWESEGLWSVETSLQDVKNAISFIQSEQMIKLYPIDITYISIVGESFGSSLGLLAAIDEPNVKKIVYMAGADLSILGRLLEENEEFRKAHQAFLDESMSDPTVARGLDGRTIQDLTLKHKDDFSLVKNAEKLAQKEILLIGGLQDIDYPIENHVLPLYRVLQKCNADNSKIVVYDTDHEFENVREEVRNLIVAWIKEGLPNTQGKYKKSPRE
jgi:pimeloyl-ACP methyl ester carboxylesterase